MVRKFFALDKNYLLEEAQLLVQDSLLRELVEKAKSDYQQRNNPLLLGDAFSTRISSYQPKELSSLSDVYLTLAGVYRFRYGDNQLEFMWDGENHVEKYKREWTSTFHNWSHQLLSNNNFVQAVLDLTVFLPEKDAAQLADNRMNYAMLRFFGQQQGLPEMKIDRKKGTIDFTSDALRVA